MQAFTAETAFTSAGQCDVHLRVPFDLAEWSVCKSELSSTQKSKSDQLLQKSCCQRVAALATEQSVAADGDVDDLDEEMPEEAAQAGPSSSGQTPVSLPLDERDAYPPLFKHFVGTASREFP